MNGILYNSEAWHCLTETQIKQFQIIDNILLRKLFNAHSKTSKTFLHLETGTMPIRYIIASRRLNYLHNILSRKEDDLILRMFNAQSESPLEGDFVKLIQKDFELINESYNKSLVKSMNKKHFKKWVKLKIKKAAFNALNEDKESDRNKKIQSIKYKKLKMQSYLKSRLFSNNEIEILFRLRSRTTELKSNFKTKYLDQLQCSVKGCSQEESQEHVFSSCHTLLKLLNKQQQNKTTTKYKHIFSNNTRKQHESVVHFDNIMDIRAKLLQN